MFKAKSSRKTAVLFILILSVLGSCKNSNSWVARKYHNTLAHYNIYFNAREQFKEVFGIMRETNPDDFRGFVSVINFGDVANLKNNQPQMDEVIKRTSTLIDKYPKSKWVDDAYLLNGQAYFLKGDLYASREIFDYVIATSKDDKVIYTAKLWYFRSLYLQKGKIGEAESYITSLATDKKFPKKLLPDLNIALAEVFLKQDKFSQAYKPLKESFRGLKGKTNKYRAHFMLAQVCMRMKKFEEAEMHFAKTVKMNPPYEMAFQANISQVQILSAQQKAYAKANKILRRMLKDDKNIDYYGKIYYQMAMNELNAENEVAAIGLFQKSIQESQMKLDNQQLTTSYLSLGEYFFERENYLIAGKYYDSASVTLDEKYPDYEEISGRNDKLKDLVVNILEIQLQDSLLRMASDESFREKSIDQSIAAEKQAKANALSRAKINLPGNTLGALTTKSTFPFYNPQLRTQGAAEFKRKWGSRPNLDNWRYTSRLKKILSGEGTAKVENKDSAEKEDPALLGVSPERKVYMKRIPFKKSEKEAANQKIESAYLLVAQQYQYALDQPSNAIKYYLELLERFPESESKPKVYYELAKLYKKEKDLANSDLYRKYLADEFPESNFLKILDGKTEDIKPALSEASIGTKEVQEAYAKMVAKYQEMDYKGALELKFATDRNYLGNSMQPRFEFLQGLCNIRLGKKELGLKFLDQLIVDYPNTLSAKKAQEVLDANRRLENPVDSTTKKLDDDWAVYDGKEELFYILSFAKGTNSNMIRAALSDYSKKDYVLEKVEVSKAQSFGSQVFVYISGFSEPKVTKDFLNRLKTNATLFSSKGLFEYEQAWISKTNLQKLVVNRQIRSYMKFANI
jgi:tetratricopeptide (TPR) repeat protein